MATLGIPLGSLSLLLLFFCCAQRSVGLKENYYATSCPRAEHIVKEQVYNLYQEHGNTAVSWVRLIFHDCIVQRILTIREFSAQSCDASILLDSSGDVQTEKQSDRNFGMRNFKYVDTIKQAIEAECPGVVSCADIIVLAAKEAAAMLGGPRIAVKTGRRDSRKSSAAVVDKYVPLHNGSISSLLSAFASVDIDAEGAVALLGLIFIHSRLYPEVDPSFDPDYAVYLKGRCPTPNRDPNEVLYARNDRVTPMKLDNNYFKNLINHRGLLLVDQGLLSDSRTTPYVTKMAQDNNYFFAQFSRALTILSENNPLTGSDGEIRNHCRFVNRP
eukprot:PITA_01049